MTLASRSGVKTLISSLSSSWRGGSAIHRSKVQSEAQDEVENEAQSELLREPFQDLAVLLQPLSQAGLEALVGTAGRDMPVDGSPNPLRDRHLIHPAHVRHLRRQLLRKPEAHDLRVFQPHRSAPSQAERRSSPGHFVNEAGRLVEVLDRAAPLLFGDDLNGSLLGEDADVVADVRQALPGEVGEFLRVSIPFSST